MVNRIGLLFLEIILNKRFDCVKETNNWMTGLPKTSFNVVLSPKEQNQQINFVTIHVMSKNN